MITTDKAIEILSYMGVEGNNPDEFDACNMGILAIQALEKIRAEIEQEITYKPMEMWDYRMGLTKALEIIDKNRTGGSE